PGMALANFWDVFLPVAEDQSVFGFASHAERLQQIPCFIQSGQKLTCNTCHNSHKALDKNALQFYTEKCQSCHAPVTFDADHKNVKTGDKSCVSCHMPKSGTTDIPHVSSTDHFIRVVKEKPQEPEPQQTSKLVTFKSFTREQHEGEFDREQVLANMIYFEQVEHKAGYLERVEKHLDKLDFEKKIKFAYLSNQQPAVDLSTVTPASVSDPYTVFYISQILKRSNQPHLNWAERAVQLAPANLDFMFYLGQAYDDARQPQQAINWYQKVIELQPYYRQALVNLGYIYLTQGQYQKALELTEQALKADPNYRLAKENQVNIFLQMGQLQKGLDLLNLLIKEYPQHQPYKDLRSRIQEML
ncbi:MAG: tetratricopeptide repeat protein, partial [Hymenobacteraceae bacterium]|nr:tetratricopeptide repeat protein [Hymenobacteraceae bacterium]MDX5395904.1 tetratricopeptide repeat protein [Hymenobacteraceae bacterium]MDX5444359.1 tetratricopeptide repeat protein [Hymenobacteraceae bacterium]MDX5511959.1 tetratricopeptide repeat protein [Hymenobacteraceae bacterium]